MKIAEKIEIESIVDQIIESLGDKATIICSSEAEQNNLITSLQILEKHKGFFRRFKPEWNQASSSVKRIMKLEQIPENNQELLNLTHMSTKGLALWALACF